MSFRISFALLNSLSHSVYNATNSPSVKWEQCWFFICLLLHFQANCLLFGICLSCEMHYKAVHREAALTSMTVNSIKFTFDGTIFRQISQHWEGMKKKKPEEVWLKSAKLCDSSAAHSLLCYATMCMMHLFNYCTFLVRFEFFVFLFECTGSWNLLCCSEMKTMKIFQLLLENNFSGKRLIRCYWMRIDVIKNFIWCMTFNI